MTARVLVTRAEPGAARTCARLEALGYIPVNAATAQIVFIHNAAMIPGPGEVLALTSPNGAMAAARLTGTRSCPAFAVGDATAAAAREQGFTHVISARGDGAALASMIRRERPDGVIHVRGRDQQYDLVGALANFDIPARAVIAYAAEPIEALSAEAVTALADGAAVLVHSPLGAQRVCVLVQQAGALKSLAQAPCAAISQAAAAPLRDAGATDIAVAAAPDEGALLAALEARLR